ncbi:MAG: YbhB/YbcL family Raf kinase inhibitor-like protein [Gammaproteobacteria bacterium]|nr:YbhB/YbcL family Raf kinase inhibitor-like protein [Gammaproteobacteria bacterium]
MLVLNEIAIADGEKTMKLTSIAFNNGAEIPMEYTCQGKNVSPQLSIADISPKARSLALIVDDPDAPDPAAPKMTWVHWILYNIPADLTEIPKAANKAALPKNVRDGINDWKKTGYGGPCPPIGCHRYFFKLYALDVMLDTADLLSKTQLELKMEGHIIDQAELMGTYQKIR